MRGIPKRSRTEALPFSRAPSPYDDVDWVTHFRIPQRDPAQPFPVVRWPASAEAVANRACWWTKRIRQGRRLAYVDSHFPWRRSGFRYSDALALFEARPDTLFFSSYELTDPFPAPVHPLADFPRIAETAGVTDVYAVFLLFLQGICGLGPYARSGSSHFMEGPNLWPLLRRRSIRVHGSIYPGGGFTLTDHGFEAAAQLTQRLTTTFSHVPELIERVPGIIETDGAFTDTEFYGYSEERWARTAPLVCLFAADGLPRKGLDAVIEAFRQLGPEMHLHVVGPHEHRLAELPSNRATFHGWLQPEVLREIHVRTHVFLSPVRCESPGTPADQEGVTDGFPTQAAADAMSSGCLLLSCNPRDDHRVLTPSRHYVRCGPEGTDVLEALLTLAADPARMQQIARSGAEQVRRRLDVKIGVRARLGHMKLIAPVPPGP